MTSELEKIDLLRARTGISYKEAKQVLEDVKGDIVAALINIEEKNRKLSEKMLLRGENLMVQMKGLLHKSYDTKIRLIKEEHTVVEVPATIGVLGLIGVMVSRELALLGAFGAMSAVANKYTMEIDLPDGDNTNKMMGEKVH